MMYITYIQLMYIDFLMKTNNNAVLTALWQLAVTLYYIMLCQFSKTEILCYICEKPSSFS